MNRIGELGIYAAAHAAASSVVTSNTLEWLDGRRATDEERADGTVERRRLLLSAALATAVVSQRWNPENRLLAATVLATKLLGVLPPETNDGVDGKGPVFLSFFLASGMMWTKWPAAASGATSFVHPEFTATMAKLCGIGGREAVKKFAADPTVALRFGAKEHFAFALRGATWGMKTLLAAYLLQATVGWASKKRKDIAGLARRVRQAVENALRTQLVYQMCASYSVWAFGYFAPNPPFLGAWPNVTFLLEPLPRLRTMTMYHAGHLLYSTYMELIQVVQKSSSPGAAAFATSLHSFVLALGLPVVLLCLSAANISPAAEGLLRPMTLKDRSA